MATPTQAQINAQIGNAVRELAPGTTWKYHQPDGYQYLDWMDDADLQPTKEAVLAKAEQLAIEAAQ